MGFMVCRVDVVNNEINQSHDGENGHNGRLEDETSNIYDEEEEEEEEEEDDDDDDDEEDKIAEQMADMDICDEDEEDEEEEDEDEDDELDNYDIEYDEEDEVRGLREKSLEKNLNGIRERMSPSICLEDDDEDDDEALDDLISSEKCDCFHCKKQAQNEQKVFIYIFWVYLIVGSCACSRL